MIEFEFSIRATLREAWAIFKKHVWYFLCLAVVVVVLNLFSQTHSNWFLSLIVAIASGVWGYVIISSALSGADSKDGMLSFSALKLHFPDFKQFLRMIGVSIVSGLIILAGLIMLVIPGIYFMTRLMFANFALVDRKEGVMASVKYSWRLVKGEIFWTVFLSFLVMVALMFVGLIFLGVGILVTYPLAFLFIAILYRKLTHYKPETAQAVAEQPVEIPTAPAETSSEFSPESK